MSTYHAALAWFLNSVLVQHSKCLLANQGGYQRSSKWTFFIKASEQRGRESMWQRS